MTAVPGDPVIALRARQDLVIRPQVFRRRRCWCVKDPVSLAYFHLSDDEYSLLRMLDGRTTLGALRKAFERRTPGLSLGAEALQAFLGGLYRNGLVTAESPQSGATLWQRRRTNRARAVWHLLPGILAIRFRGVDPSRPLSTLHVLFRWIFSPWCLGFAGAFVATAIVFAATRFGDLLAALPAADAFFTAGNLALLFAVIGGVKVLHELAHGLTCRHFGGECHEIGVMLLVFAPCLYCDVSDSWMFAQKRRRIAVAAAGIVVELILAAVATFGWWFSEPGLFHAVCLNVMLVCSINTIWLNGNPLLRYDGYFVLSDLLEIPNLAAESRAAVARLIFGEVESAPRFSDGPTWILLTYGVLSAVYRIALTIAIAWMVLKLLTPIGLAPVGYAIAGLCAVGLIAGPIAALKSAIASPRRNRALAVLVTGAAIVAAVGFLPLPHRIEAPVILQPRGAHRIYAQVGGLLIDAPTAGQNVEADDVLGRLDNPELERELAELKGEYQRLLARLDSLQSRRFDDGTAAGRLSATKEAVEGVAAQLETRRRSYESLTLSAPAGGTILPPPDRVVETATGELGDWSGNLLALRNRGCYVEPGTLICLVGDPRRFELALYVVEGQVEALQPGQAVSVLLDQSAGNQISGKVEAISSTPLREVPQELAQAGLLPVQTDADGTIRPVETTYEVRVKLDDGVDAADLRIRGIGRAKVTADSRTIAERFRRFLRRTFRFEL